MLIYFRQRSPIREHLFTYYCPNLPMTLLPSVIFCEFYVFSICLEYSCFFSNEQLYFSSCYLNSLDQFIFYRISILIDKKNIVYFTNKGKIRTKGIIEVTKCTYLGMSFLIGFIFLLVPIYFSLKFIYFFLATRCLLQHFNNSDLL